VVRAILATTVATIALTAAAAPAADLAMQVNCPKFQGPMWSRVDPFQGGEEITGTTWKLQATGVPCTFAAKWAKTLVKTPFKGEAVTKFRVVPKGWICRPSGDMLGGGKGTPGQCNLGRKMIFWAPAIPA
jgi:hypothetical protein